MRVFNNKKPALYAIYIIYACIFVLNFNNTSAANYTLTLTSSGSQNINVTADANTAISADSINVATTCRYGYNFTINTSVNNNNLYLNGNSANNQSDTYFTPASGIASLKDNPNSWGYYYNSNASTIPTDTSVFNAVPTLANPTTLRTPLTTPASSDINDNFNIYYGVSSSDSMPVGTYKMIPDTNNSNNDGTIVYTATIADACLAYTVHYNPTGTNMGTSVTGTGTVADQTIYEGVATNLTNSYFTGPTINGTTYYFTGWNTAQDGSGTSYTRGQSVTDLTTVGNTITLYAQWTDCPGNYICYSNNGATGPTVSGNVAANDNQSVSSTATTVAHLHAPNFYRTSYGFLGWSTIQLDPDDSNFATDFAYATAAGKVYGPNERLTITAGQYSIGGLRLYAVWLPKSTTYTMQTFGETECTANLTKITYATDTNSNSGISFTTENQDSITLASFIALQDARDTNVYTVARLTDGNCWMIDNLRLENTNSDNSTGSLAQGYHSDSTYGNFIGLANPETANFTSTTTSDTDATTENSIYYAGTQNGTATINISQTDYAGTRMPRYNNYNTQSITTNSTGANNTYGYGNYYTWPAAMANTTYYYGPAIIDSDGKTSETVNTSICPTGWRLPYGRSTGNGILSKGFSYLSASMGGLNTDMNSSSTPTGEAMSNRLRQFPNNFVYSGYFSNSSASYRGIYGNYRSSTAEVVNTAYVLQLRDSNVNPGTGGNYKHYGQSVRCVAGN